MHGTYALIYGGGGFFTYPAADWHAPGRKKLFANYSTFSFPSFHFLFFTPVQLARQQRQNETLGPPLKKRIFLLLCKERAIADLQDKFWIAVATGNIHIKASQEQK